MGQENGIHGSRVIIVLIEVENKHKLRETEFESLISLTQQVIYLSWSNIYIYIYIYIYILHEIRKRKANWIGHILRRNCLLKQVIEGKIKGPIEVTRRRGRRRKKPLDDLKDRRGYCQLKEEAVDRTMWRNRFGRGFGPVV